MDSDFQLWIKWVSYRLELVAWGLQFLAATGAGRSPLSPQKKTTEQPPVKAMFHSFVQ